MIKFIFNLKDREVEVIRYFTIDKGPLVSTFTVINFSQTLKYPLLYMVKIILMFLNMKFYMKKIQDFNPGPLSTH